jgi:hypothetical protein
MAPPTKTKKRRETRTSAVKFLRDLLIHGSMLKADIDQVATSHGITQKQLRGAAEELERDGMLVRGKEQKAQGRAIWWLHGHEQDQVM